MEPSYKTAQQTVWSKKHCLGCIGFYVYTVYTCVYLYICIHISLFRMSALSPYLPNTIEWYFIFLQLQLHRFRVNLIPEQNEEESAAGGSNPALNGEKLWKMGHFAKRMRFKYAMCSNLVYNLVYNFVVTQAVCVENPGMSGITLQTFAPYLSRIQRSPRAAQPALGGSHEEPPPHAGDPEIAE